MIIFNDKRYKELVKLINDQTVEPKIEHGLYLNKSIENHCTRTTRYWLLKKGIYNITRRVVKPNINSYEIIDFENKKHYIDKPQVPKTQLKKQLRGVLQEILPILKIGILENEEIIKSISIMVFMYTITPRYIHSSVFDNNARLIKEINENAINYDESYFNKTMQERNIYYESKN